MVSHKLVAHSVIEILISTVDFPPLSAKFAAYQIRSKAVIPYVLMERNKIPEAAMRQLALESNLDMLEKQVRMLVKLAERSPVVKGKLTDEIVKALEPGTEYVIVERQSMNELLEGMELWAYLVKNQLFGKNN